MLAVVAACLWPLVHKWAPRPSEQLLESTAEIAAALLVAYAIEASWLLRVDSRRDAERESWIGFCCGLGAGGLLGIAVCLLLAERARIERWNSGDELLFSFLVAAVLILGLLVVVLPLATYEWSRRLRAGDPDED